VRLIYRAGPSIDINNKGLFIALNGTAGFGMNFGLAKFTADMNGNFLVAVHKSGNLPQLSVAARMAPTSSIPGLWSAGSPKDIRIHVSQNGIQLVGIPSALQALEDGLAWLDDQLQAAKEKTWQAISDGMDTLAAAGETLWNLAESGVELAEKTWDEVVDIFAQGGSVIIRDGKKVLGWLGDAAENAGQTLEEFINDPVGTTVEIVGGAINTGVDVVGNIGSGIVSFFSKRS
jgi:hypothetical protein